MKGSVVKLMQNTLRILFVSFYIHNVYQRLQERCQSVCLGRVVDLALGVEFRYMHIRERRGPFRKTKILKRCRNTLSVTGGDVGESGSLWLRTRGYMFGNIH